MRSPTSLVHVLVTATMLSFAASAQDGTAVSVRSGKVVWRFDTHAGLHLLGIEYTAGENAHTLFRHETGRPLFDLSVTGTLPVGAAMNASGGYDWEKGPGRIDPALWRVLRTTVSRSEGGDTAFFELEAPSSAGDLAGTVRVSGDDSGDVAFSFAVASMSRERYLRTSLRAPILEEMHLGDDVWYFFPRGRGILSAHPCRLASFYGQYVWMQCMGSYGADTGLTLSLVPLERQAQPKLYITQKSGANRVVDFSYNAPLHEDLLNRSGVTQAIVWYDWVADIGEKACYGPVAVRIRKDGDWRGIYRHYQEYLRTWWRPKTREWVRHAYVHCAEHPYCADSIEEHIGWVLPFHDQVEFHLAKPFNLSRYLDYSLVGLDNPEGIYRIVEGWRSKGVRASVYVHGKAISPEDEAAKAHAYDWGLATPPVGEARGGPPGTGSPHGLHWMNLHVPEWRAWLGTVTTDILSTVSADGIRLDCIGFTMADGGNGANPRVQTPPTRHHSQVAPSVATVAHVRDAMDLVAPDATLGTENLGTDLMMNLSDYALCYNIWDALWVPKEVYPSPVSYIRFVFPDFKFFEINPEPPYDGSPSAPMTNVVGEGRRWPEGEDIYVATIHQMMFNGVGMHGWCRAPQYVPLIETFHRVMRENTDCFEGENPLPEIPTLNVGIYANRFAASTDPQAPRVITLMNWTHEPFAGPAIALDMTDQERVVELIALRNVLTGNGRASLDIQPMRAAVLRVVPGAIRAVRRDESISVRLPKARRAGQKLVAYAVTPDGAIDNAEVTMLDSATATVRAVRPNRRVAIELLRLDYADSVSAVYAIEDVVIVE
ncbi:MAG TPA: hypothetical protein HPP77_10325 [Candidatus Hydrogenedentes bacterium]|nr:hypothetical protein [Candidatus Hydrogenedentota bacterium]HIJ72890.1 hypothetical protein [Candidatus Hydrogenedentota bacterium]